MQENSKYRLTTIQRLAPSLEEIDFHLTKTVIGEKNIGSLAFSVSIQKISYQSIKVDDQTQTKNKGPFNLQQKLVQVKCDNSQMPNQVSNFKKKQKDEGPIKKYKKLRQLAQINRVILNIQQSKIRVPNLATTSSTIKNISPSRGNSPNESSTLLRNRTKKSFTIKSKAETCVRQTKQKEKYAPYLQKCKLRRNNQNKNRQQSSVNKSNNRRKIFSTRK